MYKKLFCIFLCFGILFFSYIEPYSLDKPSIQQEISVSEVKLENNIIKIGQKQLLFFSIKNLSNNSIKKINIKLETTFAVDNESFIIEELKPDEEYNEETYFYVLNNKFEKKIKFIITYTDLNGNLKLYEYYDKLDIKVDVMDQYFKLIPFLWLFLIFSIIFFISYKKIKSIKSKKIPPKC